MTPNDQNLSPEEENEFVELIDEEGDAVSFEHLATLEYQGESYLVLSPAEAADADSDEQEIVILHIRQDASGQDVYEAPDDATEEAVFEYFLTMIDQMDDEDAGE